MDANEYQERAVSTASDIYLASEWCEAITLCVLGLCGEAGEVADYVKKCIERAEPIDVEKLMLENGDVLWYASVLAKLCDVTLDAVMRDNLAKLARRHGSSFNPQELSTRTDTYRDTEYEGQMGTVTQSSYLRETGRDL